MQSLPATSYFQREVLLPDTLVASNMTKRTVAVIIGAGPAGLIALKELLEAGVDAIVLEASSSLGGVFAAARIYDGALLTTSSNIVSYGCWPAPHPEVPVMWAAQEYIEYLNGFVAAHNLARHIRYETRVTEVLMSEVGVVITAKTGDMTAQQLAADHVVVCSGLSSHKPEVGTILPDATAFGGTIIHSSLLRSSAELEGKRVLIVGAGESGSDICLLAARVATKAALSMRRGPGYIIPRYVFGLPSDVDTCRAYHSLPRWLLLSRWHGVKVWIEELCLTRSDDRAVLDAAAAMNKQRGRGPFERFGCKNTSIAEAVLRHGLALHPGIRALERDGAVFADGSRFACDVIVVCTGYRTQFPFLETTHPELAAALTDVRSALYKRVFHPDWGTRISFCGFARPGLGAIPPIAELQARYVAAAITGAATLPTALEMRSVIVRDAALERSTFPDDATRVAALTDYAPMMDALAGLLGVRPSVIELLLGGHWRLAWKLFFSSLSGAQFRLRGPGASWETASCAIEAYPTLPMPVVLWELAALVVCRLLSSLGFSSCALRMSS